MKVKNEKLSSKLLIMLLLLILLSGLSMTFGDAKIGFTETYIIVLENIKKVIGMNFISHGTKDLIIMNIRLPRILTAIVVGAGLSAVGCSYQGVFKNSMADPYILGISSGATLGAALVIISFKSVSLPGISLIAAAAFLGALITTFLVYFIAAKDKKVSTQSLLLSGIAISYFLSAIVSILLVFNEKDVARIIYWTMGSLASTGYLQLAVMTPAIGILTYMLWRYSGDLDILTAGDEVAMSMGVETSRVRQNILIISSFIVAICVAFTGTIGFVGLIIPHLARNVVGPSHSKLIPFSMVTGSIFLIFADTAARSAIDGAQLPVGAVTAVLGAPFFIYLLMKNKRG